MLDEKELEKLVNSVYLSVKRNLENAAQAHLDQSLRAVKQSFADVLQYVVAKLPKEEAKND